MGNSECLLKKKKEKKSGHSVTLLNLINREFRALPTTRAAANQNSQTITRAAASQLVREHSATVVSARWATLDLSWQKEWNKCARVNLHFKKKKKRRRGMNGRRFSQKSSQARKNPPPANQNVTDVSREDPEEWSFCLAGDSGSLGTERPTGGVRTEPSH